MLALVAEARVFRRARSARALSSTAVQAHNVIARQTAQSLAEHDLPALAARIGEHIIFAEATQSGRLVFERQDGNLAAREIAALASEIDKRAITTCDRYSGFAARPRDAESRIRTPDPSSSGKVAADLHSARPTVDATPALRGRIEIAAFQRGITAADMP